MGSLCGCLERKQSVHGVDNTPLLDDDEAPTPQLRLSKPLSEPQNVGENFAITLAGDTQTGKSALLARFVDGVFVERYVPTAGVEFKSKVLKVGLTTVKLQVWDTAGQERFRTIAATYFRAARAVCLVFDITNIESFASCVELLKEVRKNNPSKDLVLVLLGSRADEDAQRMVQSTTANAFAEENGMKYFETSAKDGRNVEEAFTHAARQLLDQKKLLISSPITSPRR
jgi:Ras-related protein Rab-1A